MDEISKANNKIKNEAKKLRKHSADNIKQEIKENYKIGIEYYQDIEKQLK